VLLENKIYLNPPPFLAKAMLRRLLPKGCGGSFCYVKDAEVKDARCALRATRYAGSGRIISISTLLLLPLENKLRHFHASGLSKQC